MSIKDKVLFIANPLEGLKIATDSSLALAEAYITLGFDVYWCDLKNIEYLGYQIQVLNCQHVTECSVSGVNFIPHTEKYIEFSDFRYCLIRTDPPFDESYKDLCWILNTQNKVEVINDPISLLGLHEKSGHLKCLNEGFVTEKHIVPTCVSNNIETFEYFLKHTLPKNNTKIILKPWLGYAGKNISCFENSESLIYFLKSTLQNNSGAELLNEKWIVQPFLDEIFTLGDTRVLIVKGQIVGSFSRFPQGNKIASNLAQGGIARYIPLTEKQIEISNQVGLFLRKYNVAFAGLDLIGEKIGEINITSPTGIRTYEELSKTNIRGKIVELMCSP